MKTFIILIAFVVLFKGIELLPTSGSRTSFIKPSNSNNGPAFGSTRKECPSVNMIGNVNVFHSCINGKLYVNNEIVKGVKPTDKVLIIYNNLKVNSKFIRHIPPNGKNNTSKFGDDDGKTDVEEESDDDEGEEEEDDEGDEVEEKVKNDFNIGPAFGSTKKGCPGVNMIGNVNVFHKCVNGELYVNNEIVKGIKPTDNVLIISNDLKVNNKFTRHIPPYGKNSIKTNVEEESDDDEGEEEEYHEGNENEEEETDDDEGEEEEGAEEEEEEDEDNDEKEEEEDEKNYQSDDDDDENEDNADGDDDDDDDDDDYINYNGQKNSPPVNMNFTNGVSVVRKNGKLFINGSEQKYKPTDKVLIDHNNLYVNGKFIRYIKPEREPIVGHIF